MKTLWVLVLGAVPIATLTVRGFLESRPADASATAFAESADTASAAATAEKAAATVKSQKPVAEALLVGGAMAPTEIASLEALPPESPLGPLRRSWPAWTAARTVIEQFLVLPDAEGQEGLDRLKAVRQSWEEFQQKLDAAKLPGASALAAWVRERLGSLRQRIARLESQAEAAESAALVASAFRARQYDQCLMRSRQWLASHSGAAEAALSEQVKALGYRAEFHVERERSSVRLNGAASSSEKETVLAAFLDRYSQPGSLDGSERVVLEQCRTHLEALRAEAAAKEKRRAEEEAIRLGLSDLPARFEERVARAARIVQEHPSESVRAALQAGVAKWLGEFLPEKSLQGDPELREVRTKDGRILRGFFREMRGPDGAVGYKRYDTLAQRQNPTADVGTWRIEDLESAPAPPLAQRLVERYHAGRVRLFDGPDRRELWEGFAAFCERIQSQWDEYRAMPGAGDEPIGFREEAAFARQVVSGPALRDLRIVWGAPKQP